MTGANVECKAQALALNERCAYISAFNLQNWLLWCAAKITVCVCVCVCVCNWAQLMCLALLMVAAAFETVNFRHTTWWPTAQPFSGVLVPHQLFELAKWVCKDRNAQTYWFLKSSCLPVAFLRPLTLFKCVVRHKAHKSSELFAILPHLQYLWSLVLPIGVVCMSICVCVCVCASLCIYIHILKNT